MNRSPYHHTGWERVAIVGSGPSFDAEQAHQLAVARSDGLFKLVLVNDAWRRFCPLGIVEADLVYASDGAWWRRYYRDEAFSHPEGTGAVFSREKWTADAEAARDLGLDWIALNAAGRGLTSSLCAINGGGNSGYQAVNLAYLFGAEYMLLVGFDMTRGPRSEEDPEGKAHWFGDHPEGLANIFAHEVWAHRFIQLGIDLSAQGIDCANASKRSAISERAVRRSTVQAEVHRLLQLS